jgi:hypothetical protein
MDYFLKSDGTLFNGEEISQDFKVDTIGGDLLTQ